MNIVINYSYSLIFLPYILTLLYSSFPTSDCQSNLHRSEDHFVLQLEMFSIKWSSPLFIPLVRSSFAVKGRNTFFRRNRGDRLSEQHEATWRLNEARLRPRFLYPLSIYTIHRGKFRRTEKERISWKSVYIERHEALWLSPSFILPLPVEPSSNRNRRPFNENCAKWNVFLVRRTRVKQE